MKQFLKNKNARVMTIELSEEGYNILPTRKMILSRLLKLCQENLSLLRGKKTKDSR